MLPGKECIGEVLQHGLQIAVFVVHALVHGFRRVDKGYREPSQGSQPEIRACTGLLIRPVHLAGLIIAVIVETGLFILHKAFDIFELPEGIKTALEPAISFFILHIERLSHIETIKPDLIRVDLLVPEIPFLCARHGVKL